MDKLERKEGVNVASMENYKPKRVERVWECECGGQHFYLYADGTITCRSCNEIRVNLIWGYRE